MDIFWEQALQSIPDDHFVSAAETYTTLNVWYDSQNGTSRFEKKSVKKEQLGEWARVCPSSPQDSKETSQLVFQGLVVSTHDFNDYPVDISRDDLAHVAKVIGISSAHVSLLFAPYTGYATLDRQVCWYYGLPGLRALAATSTSTSTITSSAGTQTTTTATTRAIITVTGSWQSALEEDLHHLSAFARHPLFLACGVRASALSECERLMKVYFNSLREVERLTGFHTNYDDDDDKNDDNGSQKASEVSSARSTPIDLGRLTKKVGSAASNLGNFKIILAQLGSIRDILRADDRLKWAAHFSSQPLLDYERQSEAITEMDETFEFMRRGLLEAITEYQDRAKSLQSVIFNLIAKEDANSSNDIAQESRAIAVATRNDGTSMKTIAIMTMVFLPATFYAALFAIPTLQWEQSPVIQSKFWMYWAFTIPSTVVVLLVWYVIVTRQVEKERRSKEEADNNRRKGSGLSGRHRAARSIFRPFMKSEHQSFRDSSGFGHGPPDDEEKNKNSAKLVPNNDVMGLNLRQRSAGNDQQGRSTPQKAEMNSQSTAAVGDDRSSLAYHMA